jgi:hypothetical protein
MDDNTLPSVYRAKAPWQRYRIRHEVEYKYTIKKTPPEKPAVSDPHQHTTHIVALAIVWVLGMLDLGLTALWIGGGEIEESNPIMGAAYEIGGITGFALLKIAITSMCCWVLWIGRDHLLARLAALGSITLYTSINTLQVLMIYLSNNPQLLG